MSGDMSRSMEVLREFLERVEDDHVDVTDATVTEPADFDNGGRVVGTLGFEIQVEEDRYYTCPVCDRDDFESERALNIHISRSHPDYDRDENGDEQASSETGAENEGETPPLDEDADRTLAERISEDGLLEAFEVTPDEVVNAAGGVRSLDTAATNLDLRSHDASELFGRLGLLPQLDATTGPVTPNEVKEALRDEGYEI